MKIAILGMGVVGTGAYEALRGRDTGLEVKRVLDKRRLPGALEALRTEDIGDILADGEIEAVVEAMGGLESAYAYVMAALRAKKHVVSSNKQLVSARFFELHTAAAENGVQLRYTASSGGGIPWLYNLARARRLDDIWKVEGVINGTTNFILDNMHKSGAPFDEILREAQRLGYAEADPAADIDGADTRRKCAISASVAFDGMLEESAIPCFGIRGVSQSDIAFANREGYACRLMFYAQKAVDGVYAAVRPVFLPMDALAAHIHGCDNLVSLYGRLLGPLRLAGQGAGGAPTGLAVAQDLLDVRAGIPGPAPALRPLPLLSGGERGRYYLRKGAQSCIREGISMEEAIKEGADFLAQMEA